MQQGIVDACRKLSLHKINQLEEIPGLGQREGDKADERIEHPNPRFKTVSANVFYG
jgi:hypothetical protein